MDNDGAFPSDSTFETFLRTDMDLDFMDELLYEGCWLETAAAEVSFSQPGPSTSSALNNPLQYIPCVESNSGHFSTNPNQEVPPKNTHCRVEKFVEAESQNRNAAETSTSLIQSESCTVEGSEMARRWWIGPVTNPDPSSSVKERLKHAIRQLKDSTKDKDVLIQIWVPIKKGDKQFLTTSDQPYLLDPKSTSLACFRNASENYHLRAEEGSKEFIGLPGRVFLQKLPEWTPDVRFFRIEEYPRKNYAHQYNIGGSLAVPVFEQGSRTCLGVVEVVTTTQKINYRPELESVCKALEAVDLRSSQDFCPPSVKACREFCQAAAPEISGILKYVCKIHRLPLALTWAPCFKKGKGGCQHFDEKYASCISTVDSACFVANKEYLPFHVVCSEQYLFLGQGIAGRAFMTNKQCFASDVTAFSKTDYPFSHHAMMFGLHSAIAIPLRDMYDESADFVLELFFPKDCRDPKEHQRMRDLLPIAIQQACRSLHVVMDKELEEDINRKSAVTSDGIINIEEPQKFISSSLKESSPENSSWIANMMESQPKGTSVHVSWDFLKEEPNDDFKVTTHWRDNTEELYHKQVLTDFGQLRQQFESNSGVESGKTSFAGTHSLDSRKTGKKRQTKTEKTISLEVLRQYFAGSLKDAAKSIGVCPTTLKRICRQHGITRWPSRKIKKVDHSLRKLQLVMDSVQGAEGAIQLGSFYSTFPELGSPDFSGGLFSSIKTNCGSQLDLQPENGMVGNGAVASKSPSSSCSQSSGSSFCCSSGEKQHITIINVSSTGDTSKEDDPGGVLKRTWSDAELHASSHEEPKLLARSQSHKIFGDGPSLETLPPIPKSVGRNSRSGNVYRVKATYGEDKFRFSLQPNWGFKDLQQEIAKHFKIDDVNKIDLKYLDDDEEWVLLTCDADLKECKDICTFTHSHTIKMSLHQASPRQMGSSFGSGGHT